MSIERTIRYTGKEVTILWKPQLCIHSKKCWLNLPAVFKPGERPWIHPDGAEGQRIIDQVRQCPSGALSIATQETAAASSPATNVDGYTSTGGPGASVEVIQNGPLIVKGTIEVKHADGRMELKEERCTLCRCGGSANKPYCDGSHRKNGFQG